MRPPSGAGRHGVALLLLAVATACWWAAGPRGDGLVADMAITAILAMSLSFLVGQAGLVSVGHAAFSGIGAYAFAGLALGWGWPPALALPAAVALGAVAALLLGLATVRLSGVLFMVATFVAGEALQSGVWASGFLGGASGMAEVPRLDLSPLGIDIADAALSAPFMLAVAGLVYLLLDRLVLSHFGQTLRAIRQNEERARALGCQVGRYKLAAFVVSGTLAALAGTLAVQLGASVSPDLLSWTVSVELLALVVVGGATSLLGVATAAALWVGLRHQLPTLGDHWLLAAGAAAIVLAVVAAEGIDGALRTLWRRLALRRSA